MITHGYPCVGSATLYSSLSIPSQTHIYKITCKQSLAEYQLLYGHTHPCVRCTISLIAIITYTITNTLTLTITTYLAQATNSNTPNHLLTDQCDQIKIAKCLYKLPKNEFTRKINDFDTFTKIAQHCGCFGVK